jgi:hypothetical protein
MTPLLPALAATFAAFCVWLTVRVVNRRERWAKWTLAITLLLLAVYPFSYGPARWFYLKTGIPEWTWPVVDSTFEPLWWVRENSPTWFKEAMFDYDAWWIDLALNR